MPPAMCTGKGKRLSNGKSALKRSLHQEVSCRNSGRVNVNMIGGLALHWPTDGTVEDDVTNVKARVAVYLRMSNVYLIFDSHHDFSIQSVTRDGRENAVTRSHHLHIATKLTAQKVVSCSVENKSNSIELTAMS